MDSTPETPSIQEIIEREWIGTVFHSLVSIKRKSLLGVEALARCTAPDEDIPPLELFRMAQEADCVLELDRLCRKKALEAFAPIHQKNRGIILSINVDGHAIDADVARSGYLLHMVKEAGVNPNNVLIEIVESRARHRRTGRLRLQLPQERLPHSPGRRGRRTLQPGPHSAFAARRAEAGPQPGARGGRPHDTP